MVFEKRIIIKKTTNGLGHKGAVGQTTNHEQKKYFSLGINNSTICQFPAPAHRTTHQPRTDGWGHRHHRLAVVHYVSQSTPSLGLAPARSPLDVGRGLLTLSPSTGPDPPPPSAPTLHPASHPGRRPVSAVAAGMLFLAVI
jgi:hypothetical protein